MLKLKIKPEGIEAKQFLGLDSYLEIIEWMKSCGDTFANANEIKYSTPIMLIQTLKGTMAANPGDWIIRTANNEFHACTNEIFVQLYQRSDSK